MTQHLIAPYCGTLVDVMADPARRQELRAASREWSSIDLGPRQLCDLELLLTGALSPLRGFMGQRAWERVCREMRLPSGTLWPVPITLDVPGAVARDLSAGQRVALRDPEGVMLAALAVDEVWEPDRRAEAEQVYGTADPAHPGVQQLLEGRHPFYVGGELEGVELPAHYDFQLLRLTPAELREQFLRRGWRRVMAYHTRGPIHRLHHAMTLRAARQTQTNLLLHPAVEQLRPGEAAYFSRVRCYQEALRHYPRHTAMLSLVPLSTRLAGPREALLHGIIRRNYGCTHLLVGQHHASPDEAWHEPGDQSAINARVRAGRTGLGGGPGPGAGPGGGEGVGGEGVGGEGEARASAFYEPYEAQELFASYQEELGIEMVAARELVYLPSAADFVPADEVHPGEQPARMSQAELASRLARGQQVPQWVSFPEVLAELGRAHPPRHRQGFTVFFSGLSGAGKSTIANVLMVRLLELGGRPVTLLDGDIVRRHLSSELSFSREHRDINIRRIGFVAAEITKNGGIAICAPIAPYDRVRQEVRRMVSPGGGFVLVHVATPIDVCEQRDRKGMYAKARAGIIKNYTGVSDPYEVPEDADLSIDTTDLTPEQCAQQVLLFLEKEGFVAANGGAGV